MPDEITRVEDLTFKKGELGLQSALHGFVSTPGNVLYAQYVKREDGYYFLLVGEEEGKEALRPYQRDRAAEIFGFSEETAALLPKPDNVADLYLWGPFSVEQINNIQDIIAMIAQEKACADNRKHLTDNLVAEFDTPLPRAKGPGGSAPKP